MRPRSSFVSIRGGPHAIGEVRHAFFELAGKKAGH
jgi:hypothetical protein